MYKIPQLLKYKYLFHVFSDKSDGNMANSINGVVNDFEKVSENRAHFLNNIDVDIKSTVCMWVTHGDEIIDADPKLAGVSILDYHKAVKVDGLITDKKEIYLFLLIADCLPIIIYDPVNNVVALVHAGWKGVDKNIAGKVVEKFKSKYNSKIGDLVVGIGPSVHQDSFIKVNPSQKDDPRWKDFMHKIAGDQFKVDLQGFVKKQLIDSESG